MCDGRHRIFPHQHLPTLPAVIYVVHQPFMAFPINVLFETPMIPWMWKTGDNK
jgi:hypothetical protein